MKISIIVPVYNVRAYLPKCLDSLISQTFKDIEIIVVDDGSTDGSGEYVDEYSASHQDLMRVIHKTNGGLMSAWTTGVRESKGEYIGFVDSDDFVAVDMYESLYDLAYSSNADIVVSNYIINGRIKGSHPIKEGLYKGNELYTTFKEHIFPSPYTYNISNQRMPKLYKRHIIIDNLKYTESLSRTFEDRYIMPAAILSAESIYYTPSAYYNWIMREGSNHVMYKANLLDEIKRVYGTQHQIVMDKYQELEKKWEEGYLDFVRLYVERNILRVRDFSTKRRSAKVLLEDDLTKKRLGTYGKLMGNKMGKAVKAAYRINSPSLLAIFSFFA